MIIATMCLIRTPIRFSVGGINTSILELLTMLTATYGLLSTSAKSSTLWAPYIFLLLSVVLSFAIGVDLNGPVRALRDIAQLVYISFIFFGYFFYYRKYIKPETLILYICWIATAYSLLYLLDVYWIQSGIFYDYRFEFRVISIFAYMNLLGRLFDIPGSVRINIVTVVCMLLALSLYAIDIRTRAFLLMLIVGCVTVFLQYIFLFPYRASIRLLFIGGTVLLFLVFPFILQWFELDIAATGSLGRLLVLWSSQSLDVTAQYRIDAGSLALDGFYNNLLFGTGFGSYIFLDPWIRGDFQYYPSAMIHNQFLHILYVGGILYFAGFLYFLWKIYSSIGYGVQTQQKWEVYGRNIIGRGFLIGFLVYAAFGTTWFAVSEAIVFWFLIGYFCQFRRPALKRSAIKFHNK